jgi:hypothetical protein
MPKHISRTVIAAVLALATIGITTSATPRPANGWIRPRYRRRLTFNPATRWPELTKRIIRPLNLSHTESADHIRPMPHPYLHGYLTDDRNSLVDVSQRAGDASSMISTTKDIRLFFADLFGGQVLGTEQLKEMLTIPNVPTPIPVTA